MALTMGVEQLWWKGSVGYTNRTHWSLRVAYSSDENVRRGGSRTEGGRALSSSVDDLYEAHLVVYDELFPVCIFYRRVIGLKKRRMNGGETVRGRHTSVIQG